MSPEWIAMWRDEHMRREAELVKACRRAFAEQEERALAELRKVEKADWLQSQEEARRFLEHIRKPLAEAFKEFGKRVVTALGVEFDPVAEAAEAWAREYGFELAKGINRTTARVLGARLAEGMRQGESVEELAARVRAVFFDMDRVRSFTIARTETTAAATMGSSAAYELAGIEVYKWYTAEDERVCALCGPLHGTEFRIGEGPKGSHFPGPPRHPRCRCVTLGVIKEREPRKRPIKPKVPELEPGFDPDELKKMDKALVQDLGVDSAKHASIQLRGRVKDEICQKLARRLRGDKDFLKLGQMNRWGLTPALDEYGIANNLVAVWALTSGDNNELAVAVQLAAEKEFGLKGTVRPWPPSVIKSAMAILRDYESGLRKFLRAQYAETQEWLKKQNVDFVFAVRGMSFAEDNAPQGYSDPGFKVIRTELQPLSSFSVDFDTSLLFAGSDDVSMMIASRVPRERILATSRTGYGCLAEAEFVVLGGEGTAYCWTWKAGHMWPSSQKFKEAVDTFVQKGDLRNKDIPPLSPDAVPENADWTKQTWDLPDRDSEEFKELLRSWGMTEEEFDRLPAARLPKLRERRKR